MRNKGGFFMLGLNRLKTSNGTKIKIHFENTSSKIRMYMEYSKQDLQKKFRDIICREGVDTGKGTIMHLLINSLGDVRIMRENEYSKWQASPQKDWFHKQRLNKMIMDAMMAEVIDDLMNQDYFSELLLDVLKDKKHGDFTAPSEEETDEFLKDPEKMKTILAIHAKDTDNCSICIHPKCPIRDASFDRTAFETAIAATTSLAK
jgi:proteasome lid subunit RPN8/RPN11